MGTVPNAALSIAVVRGAVGTREVPRKEGRQCRHEPPVASVDGCRTERAFASGLLTNWIPFIYLFIYKLRWTYRVVTYDGIEDDEGGEGHKDQGDHVVEEGRGHHL